MNDRRTLYHQYTRGDIPFNVFCTMLDQCTQDFQCMVIKTSTGQMFSYKAQQHEFMIPSPIREPIASKPTWAGVWSRLTRLFI